MKNRSPENKTKKTKVKRDYYQRPVNKTTETGNMKQLGNEWRGGVERVKQEKIKEDRGKGGNKTEDKYQ